MALFDFETVSEIYQKAVQLSLADRRDALLAGVDQAYRATLEVSGRPSDQMLLDLRAMNRFGSATGSANSEIPLQIWLSNAALLVAAQPDLQAWLISLRDQTSARPEPSPNETQQRAETILEYMQVIARENPKLRAALIAARGDLEELVNTVILVVVTKRLHDLLHEIQIFKLPMIVATLDRGLASNEDWMMFTQQVSELEYKHARAVEELDILAEGSPERLNQESWVSDFGDMIVSMKGVIEAKFAGGAKTAIGELRRLVGKKMSDLNQLLFYSAGRLRINVLTEHLRAFAGSLAIEDVRAIELRDAASGLLKVKSELEDLLRDHNTWQRVDDDLFAAEDALVFSDRGESVLGTFSVIWPRLVGRLAKVAGAGTDGWYVDTQEYLTAFGAKCSMPATPPIAPAAINDFGQLVKATRNRFFDVDKELKARCDRLARVADPIERLAQVQ